MREAKPHELWECIPCGKTFRRKDNLDRHTRSGLHARRLAAYQAKQAQEAERKREESKPKAELVI